MCIFKEAYIRCARACRNEAESKCSDFEGNDFTAQVVNVTSEWGIDLWIGFSFGG